jgi:hypothetical protein
MVKLKILKRDTMLELYVFPEGREYMCRVKLIGYALYVLELFFACAIDTHMLEL